MADTSSKSGFYPQIDSVYAGGGFTPGVGYRGRSGDQIQWNLRGLYSIKNYKLVELTAKLADVDRNLALDLADWMERCHAGRLLRPRHGHSAGRPSRLPSADAVCRGIDHVAPVPMERARR